MVELGEKFPHWHGKCENLRIDSLNETWNPFEAALDVVHGIHLTIKCYNQIDAWSTYFSDLANDLRFYWSFDAQDVVIAFSMTIFWTLARHFFVKKMFEPFARCVGILDKNVSKFGESVWKCAAYAFMWSTAVYVTFFRGYDYFERPILIWAGTRHDSAPFDLCVVYALEASFYLHMVYATLYMDTWRKDSIVMMIHHFVTLSLIFFSYMVGYLKIGIIIFVLNDISDILLEFSKALSYLRQRQSGFSRFFDLVSTATGALFAVQWPFLRLQMHMTKVWRPGCIGAWVSMPALPVPFHFFYIVFLGCLFLFYAYWFFFIVLFLMRLIRGGKQGSLDDPREDADKNKKKKK